MDRAKQIYRVSVISIIANVFLTIFKAVFGILFNSYSLVTDAIHSLSDVFSTIVVMVGTFFAKKEIDSDHNYGHEKYESLAGLFLGLFLLFISGKMFLDAILLGIKILNNIPVVKPSKYALIAALVSIIVKEVMYRYTVIIASRVKSPALKADAWHHRSDAMSSFASFVAIMLSMVGFKLADSIGSVVICALIFKVSIEIMKESIDQITDKAAPDELTEAIKCKILENSEVKSVSEIKTRAHASKLYVDVSITVDKDITVYDSHEIAEEIHIEIERCYEDVLHMTVHVEPHLS